MTVIGRRPGALSRRTDPRVIACVDTHRPGRPRWAARGIATASRGRRRRASRHGVPQPSLSSGHSGRGRERALRAGAIEVDLGTANQPYRLVLSLVDALRRDRHRGHGAGATALRARACRRLPRPASPRVSELRDSHHTRALAGAVQELGHGTRRRESGCTACRGRLLGGLIVTGAAIAVVVAVLQFTARPQTDDATLRANFVGIAPQVSGHIVELHVRDNQHVNGRETSSSSSTPAPTRSRLPARGPASR